jgi:hypothetical protein
MKTTLSNGSPVPCALCPVPCIFDLKSILYNDEENNVSHRFVSGRI